MQYVHYIHNDNSGNFEDINYILTLIRYKHPLVLIMTKFHCWPCQLLVIAIIIIPFSFVLIQALCFTSDSSGFRTCIYLMLITSAPGITKHLFPLALVSKMHNQAHRPQTDHRQTTEIKKTDSEKKNIIKQTDHRDKKKKQTSRGKLTGYSTNSYSKWTKTSRRNMCFLN